MLILWVSTKTIYTNNIQLLWYRSLLCEKNIAWKYTCEFQCNICSAKSLRGIFLIHLKLNSWPSQICQVSRLLHPQLMALYIYTLYIYNVPKLLFTIFNIIHKYSLIYTYKYIRNIYLFLSIYKEIYF